MPTSAMKRAARERGLPAPGPKPREIRRRIRVGSVVNGAKIVDWEEYDDDASLKDVRYYFDEEERIYDAWGTMQLCEVLHEGRKCGLPLHRRGATPSREYLSKNRKRGPTPWSGGLWPEATS